MQIGFDPLCFILALTIASAGTFFFFAAIDIAASCLPPDEKILRIIVLFLVPPVGILIHHDVAPPKDVLMLARMKGWVPVYR